MYTQKFQTNHENIQFGQYTLFPYDYDLLCWYFHSSIIPITFQIRVIDLRTVSFDVPPQEILTRDSVTVAVDAVVYYKISQPMAATCNVEDYSKSTKLLASTTLRTILGTKSLSEILSDRETISNDILSNLDRATDPWGVKVWHFMTYSVIQLSLEWHVSISGGKSRSQGCEVASISATSHGRRSWGRTRGQSQSHSRRGRDESF